ncbi:MAG: SDR family oxidoreductase [Rhodanobacteraceae bacterium]
MAGSHDYWHRQRQARPDVDAALRADLHAVHAGSRGRRGRPRFVRAAQTCRHPVGPKRVAKLMHEEGLCGRCKGRGFRPDTTDSRHTRLWKQIAAQPCTHGISEDQVVNEIMLNPMPKRTFIGIDEIVGIIAFLIAPAAHNITGQTIVVDGGWTAQ